MTTLHRAAAMLADQDLSPFATNIIDALVLAIIAIAKTSPQDQAERVRNIGRIMDKA